MVPVTGMSGRRGKSLSLVHFMFDGRFEAGRMQ